MEPDKVVIRKYENRRLYDTAKSRYVNLEDIAAMVREGIEIQVIDSATGQDLTRLVLTQIIVENAKTPGSGFPLDVLRQMVMASGRASQEGFLRHMRTMYDMYQKTYRAFTPALSPLEFMQSMMSAGVPGEAPPAGDAGAQASESQQTVDELRRRLEELERVVRERRPEAPSAEPRLRAARRR